MLEALYVGEKFEILVTDFEPPAQPKKVSHAMTL